jgi:hypothetical protein
MFKTLLMPARQTHKIFAFKPNVADLHGLTVTAPWATQNPLLPPPHPDVLMEHYLQSIVAGMKGSAENHEDDEDDDDDDDDEELVDLNDVGNERVTIWDENAINGKAPMAEPHLSFSSVH